jgi:hypothetical protein
MDMYAKSFIEIKVNGMHGCFAGGGEGFEV